MIGKSLALIVSVALTLGGLWLAGELIRRTTAFASHSGPSGIVAEATAPEDLVAELSLTPAGKKAMERVVDVRVVDLTQCGAEAWGCMITHADWLGTDYYEIEILRTSPQPLKTMAHEFLHVVYSELPNRAEVDKMINVVYAEHKISLDKRMASYDFDGNPWSKRTELYAFVGTLVGNLPSELESHYNLYFDRQSIEEFFYINVEGSEPETTETAPDVRIKGCLIVNYTSGECVQNVPRDYLQEVVDWRWK